MEHLGLQLKAAVWFFRLFRASLSNFIPKKERKVPLFLFTSYVQMTGNSIIWERWWFHDPHVSSPCFISQMSMSVLQIWTTVIETCRAVSTLKGAMSVNAWRATRETGSIVKVRECMRTVLLLVGWSRRNEQETLLVIWASSASTCGAVSCPWWLVPVLFEESGKGVDPYSGSLRQLTLIISCFLILSFLSELWRPQQLIIMKSL